jgi:hypothetical protein
MFHLFGCCYWFAPALDVLLHAVDKSFQGTDNGFEPAVNSSSSSKLTCMMPKFQVPGTTIYRKHRQMGKVASTGYFLF